MPCDVAIDGVVGVCIRLAWMVLVWLGRAGDEERE
jgi:hypothetical protein